MGRIPTYNPQDFYDSILDWIKSGKPLLEWSRIDGNPSHDVVYDWLDADKEFERRFARARIIGHAAIAQECLQIADNARNDWMESKHGKQVDQECVRRSMLRIDTRLKLLAKWDPKRYGDKVIQEISGPEGGPVQQSVSVTFVKPPDSPKE